MESIFKASQKDYKNWGKGPGLASGDPAVARGGCREWKRIFGGISVVVPCHSLSDGKLEHVGQGGSNSFFNMQEIWTTSKIQGDFTKYWTQLHQLSLILHSAGQRTQSFVTIRIIARLNMVPKPFLPSKPP